MENFKFDIIIPTAEKDISFLHYVIKYIRKNIIGVNNIYIITNISLFPKIDYLKQMDNITILDENNIVPEVNYHKIKNHLRLLNQENVSVGWYLQQFLKMAFSLSVYCNNYYLSWDSDTLPLCPLYFYKEGHPYFTIKKEYNKPYFDTMERLIGLTKITDYSFIAEHMLFKTDIMKELIGSISNSSIAGNDWVEKCLNACSFNGIGSYFSEFETYGTFVSKYYPDLYKTQKLNTFRSAGLIRGRKVTEKLLNSLAIDLDIASFELYDVPPFPYNIDYYVYRLKLKMRKIFNF